MHRLQRNHFRQQNLLCRILVAIVFFLLAAAPACADDRRPGSDPRESALRALWIGDTDKAIRLLSKRVNSCKSLKDANTASEFVTLLAAELIGGNAQSAELLRAKLMKMPFRCEYIAGDTAVSTQTAEVAFIYQVNKKYAEAEGLYKKAIAFDGCSRPDITAQLAQLYKESGNKQMFAQLKRDGLDSQLFLNAGKHEKLASNWQKYYQRGLMLETAYYTDNERTFLHSPSENGTLFGAVIKCADSPRQQSLPLALTVRKIGDYYLQHDMRCDIEGPGIRNSLCKHGRFTADEMASVYERSLKMVKALKGSDAEYDNLIARLGALRDLSRQPNRAVAIYQNGKDFIRIADDIDQLANGFFPQIDHPLNEIFIGDNRVVIGEDQLYLSEDISKKAELDVNDCSKILRHRALKLRPWTPDRMKKFVEENVVKPIQSAVKNPQK